MLANYHTHTVRCHHAIGTEREYIEEAISAGLTTIGFSDHCPYLYPEGKSSNMRMTFDEISGYFETLRALAKEYSDKIKVLIGFECEYFEDTFENTMKLIKSYMPDYLILGQHFIGKEWEQCFSTAPSYDPGLLKEYADEVIKAINTGYFSYIAHPDVYNYKPDDVYCEEMSRICKEAKRLNIPLEINLLGLRTGRNYPDRRFWKIAGEIGNTAILGCDAHAPQMVNPSDIIDKAIKLASENNIKITEDIKMLNI